MKECCLLLIRKAFGTDIIKNNLKKPTNNTRLSFLKWDLKQSAWTKRGKAEHNGRN